MNCNACCLPERKGRSSNKVNKNLISVGIKNSLCSFHVLIGIFEMLPELVMSQQRTLNMCVVYFHSDIYPLYLYSFHQRHRFLVFFYSHKGSLLCHMRFLLFLFFCLHENYFICVFMSVSIFLIWICFL